jgi:hypothetical protein
LIEVPPFCIVVLTLHIYIYICISILLEFSHSGENWNCSTAETFICNIYTMSSSNVNDKHSFPWHPLPTKSTGLGHCHNMHTVVTLCARNCMGSSHILIYNLKHEYITCGPKHTHCIKMAINYIFLHKLPVVEFFK